jgi:hypothetical protein
MESWTPGDWGIFLTALVAAVGSIGGTFTTIFLQLRGNAKTEQAKAISADSNAKVSAVVAQTREIANAVPGASTAPTDGISTERLHATRAGDAPTGATP